MPLTIIDPTGDEPMYIATERLYVNRDYSQIVPAGSPDAAFLLATPGKGIPEDLARRLGLLKGKASAEPPPEPAPEPEPDAEPDAEPRRGGRAR